MYNKYFILLQKQITKHTPCVCSELYSSFCEFTIFQSWGRKPQSHVSYIACLHKANQLFFQPYQVPGTWVALALQERTRVEPSFRVESPPGMAPGYKQYIKPKQTLLVLLLLALGDGPAGPQLNWSMCSVLLKDLGHLEWKQDTQNIQVRWHQRGSTAAHLSCFMYGHALGWTYDNCTSPLLNNFLGYLLWKK